MRREDALEGRGVWASRRGIKEGQVKLEEKRRGWRGGKLEMQWDY